MRWSASPRRAATVCRMKPVTVTTTIDRPRDDIYAVLEDLMNHEAFTDHFLTDFQRTETGIRVKGKGGGGWMEITPVESTPDRIVEEGRSGRGGRRHTKGIYELDAAERQHRRQLHQRDRARRRRRPASPPRSSAPTCASRTAARWSGSRSRWRRAERLERGPQARRDRPPAAASRGPRRRARTSPSAAGSPASSPYRPIS